MALDCLGSFGEHAHNGLTSARQGVAFLARWCRACAACALLRNTRTTDALRRERFQVGRGLALRLLDFGLSA